MAIDWHKADKLIEEAFDEVVEGFEKAQIEEITSPQWEWPRVTHRRSGAVVGSPRDIVDREDLKKSLSVEPENDLEVTYLYNVEYASIVHNGAELSSGTEIPARPWIDQAVSDYDIARELEEELKKRL